MLIQLSRTKSDHSEDEFLQFLNDIQTAPEEWKHVPVPSEALSGIRKRLDSMRQGDELGIEQCKEQGVKTFLETTKDGQGDEQNEVSQDSFENA